MNRQKLLLWIFILGLCTFQTGCLLELYFIDGQQLTCKDVGTLTQAILDDHVDRREFTRSMTRQTVENFTSTLLEVGSYVLTEKEIETLNKNAKAISLEKVKQGILSGQDCSFFENQISILGRAINRLGHFFPDPQELSKTLILQDQALPKTIPGDDLISKSEEALRQKFILAFVKHYREWKESVEPQAAEEIAQKISRSYFKKVKKIQDGIVFIDPWAYILLLKCINSTFDPHTAFETKVPDVTFPENSLFGAFYGYAHKLGFSYREHPYGIEVIYIDPQSLAGEIEALQKGTLITHIDGHPTDSESQENIREFLSVFLGVPVELQLAQLENKKLRLTQKVRIQMGDPQKIEKELSEAMQSFYILRHEIQGKNILILRLKHFSDGCAEQISQTLQREKQKAPIDGLILDLRGNPGGRLSEVVSIANLFISDAPLVRLRDNGKGWQAHYETKFADHKTVDPFPLIVSVDSSSASASEILVGVLKAYQRALVIGESATFGKGTGQGVRSIRNFDFGITIFQAYLPDGSSPQSWGVSSHVLLPPLLNASGFRESKIPNFLPPDQLIRPLYTEEEFTHNTDPNLTYDLIGRLQEKSNQRVYENKQMWEKSQDRETEFTYRTREILYISLDYIEAWTQTKSSRKKTIMIPFEDQNQKKRVAITRRTSSEKPILFIIQIQVLEGKEEWKTVTQYTHNSLEEVSQSIQALKTFSHQNINLSELESP